MPDIYAQHEAAFSRVSAYVVLKDGEKVATIAFKFPADGAGRLFAYVHWVGVSMVRGFAGGYGYDKRTAAASAAVQKEVDAIDRATAGAINGQHWPAFSAALWKDGGETWDRKLEKAGFTVLQAV